MERAFALGPGMWVGKPAEVLAMLKEEAAKAMSAYPQYRGKYENYRLGMATRTVKTKMGVAVEKGELVIFRTEPDEAAKLLKGVEREHAVFFSRHTECDTAVSLETIKEVAT